MVNGSGKSWEQPSFQQMAWISNTGLSCVSVSSCTVTLASRLLIRHHCRLCTGSPRLLLVNDALTAWSTFGAERQRTGTQDGDSQAAAPKGWRVSHG